MGITVLHKSTATIRVHDSLHNLSLFGNVIELIKNLAGSIGARYGIPEQLWPRNRSLNAEMYSVQQRNTSDCGIFTMVNAILVSQGSERPNIRLEDQAVLQLRSKLALCILECDAQFVR